MWKPRLYIKTSAFIQFKHNNTNSEECDIAHLIKCKKKGPYYAHLGTGMFTLYLKELAHMHYEVLQNCFLPHIFNSLLGESQMVLIGQMAL